MHWMELELFQLHIESRVIVKFKWTRTIPRSLYLSLWTISVRIGTVRTGELPLHFLIGGKQYIIANKFAVMICLFRLYRTFLWKVPTTISSPSRGAHATARQRCSTQIAQCSFFEKIIIYLRCLLRSGRLEIAATATDLVQELRDFSIQTGVLSFWGFCKLFQRLVPTCSSVAVTSRGNPKEISERRFQI